MKDLQINASPEVEEVFGNYPDLIRKKLLNLRRLIIEMVGDIVGINSMEDPLK